MKAGLTVSLISAITIGVFTYFFLEYINTEYITYSLGEAKKTMEAQNKPEEEIQNNIQRLKESVFNPLRMAISGIGYTAIGGAFMTFISSTFLIKNPPEN